MIAPSGLAVVVAYGLGLLAIGVYVGRRRSSPVAFFLDDRTLGTVGVFATTFSTFLGTGLLFTLAAFGYRFGIGAFLLVGAAAVGLLLLAWAAPRINRLSAREGAITLPALLDQQWSDRTQALAALVTIGLFTATLAANFHVVGDVLKAFTGLSPRLGAAGFAVIVIGYTVLGGFRGVVWTDAVQLILIAVAFLLVLPIAALATVDSASLSSLPPGHLNPRSLPLPVLVAYLIIGVFAFFGSQDLFQRIYAARNPTTARRGVLLFTGLLMIAGFAAVGLGIVARAVVSDVAPDAALFPLTDAVVPAVWVGFVLLGLLALANSDADSQVLTVASNVTQDITPLIFGDLGRRWRLHSDRLAVVGIGLVALLVAVGAPSIAALLNAVGSWFAILGFVVLATLYWDRMTDTASFGGLAVGFSLPPAFIALTGNVQAATFVGLVGTVVITGLCVLLDGLEIRDRSSSGDVKPAQ